MECHNESGAVNYYQTLIASCRNKCRTNLFHSGQTRCSCDSWQPKNRVMYYSNIKIPIAPFGIINISYRAWNDVPTGKGYFDLNLIDLNGVSYNINSYCVAFTSVYLGISCLYMIKWIKSIWRYYHYSICLLWSTVRYGWPPPLRHASSCWWFISSTCGPL